MMMNDDESFFAQRRTCPPDLWIARCFTTGQLQKRVSKLAVELETPKMGVSFFSFTDIGMLRSEWQNHLNSMQRGTIAERQRDWRFVRVFQVQEFLTHGGAVYFDPQPGANSHCLLIPFERWNQNQDERAREDMMARLLSLISQKNHTEMDPITQSTAQSQSQSITQSTAQP
jgi:hypothetical protein